MKKIKSAKTTAMGRNTFGCDRTWTRNGISVGGEQQWTSGRGDYCSDSTLETLAAAGLAAVEYEEEKPRFRAGDWVMMVDGTCVCDTQQAYRAKVNAMEGDVAILACGCQYANSAKRLIDLTVALPEPPADVLADHCPPLCFKGEFRPPKMGEWYWSGTGGVCIYGFYSPAPMPRFILAPVEKPEKDDGVEWCEITESCIHLLEYWRNGRCGGRPDKAVRDVAFSGYKFVNGQVLGTLWAQSDEQVWHHATHVGFRRAGK